MNILTIYAHSNPKSFCHAVNGADDETRCNDLDRSYRLGRNFEGSGRLATA